jgi:hypothetical protein
MQSKFIICSTFAQKSHQEWLSMFSSFKVLNFIFSEMKILIFVAVALFVKTNGACSQILHGHFKRVLDFSDPGNYVYIFMSFQLQDFRFVITFTPRRRKSFAFDQRWLRNGSYNSYPPVKVLITSYYSSHNKL